MTQDPLLVLTIETLVMHPQPTFDAKLRRLILRHTSGFL